MPRRSKTPRRSRPSKVLKRRSSGKARTSRRAVVTRRSPKRRTYKGTRLYGGERGLVDSLTPVNLSETRKRKQRVLEVPEGPQHMTEQMKRHLARSEDEEETEAVRFANRFADMTESQAKNLLPKMTKSQTKALADLLLENPTYSHDEARDAIYTLIDDPLVGKVVVRMIRNALHNFDEFYKLVV